MTMPARDEALQERAAQVERLRCMPAAMRELKQWILWKLEEVEGRDGLQKVPYYANGSKRRGALGGAEDLGKLVAFDVAVQRFAQSQTFTGVGFAFVAGDGLIGIDLDWKETGKAAPHHEAIIEACASYTEVTPSGKGVHVIVRGETTSFKHDPVGVEVYCGGRYFTCTGARVEQWPAEPMPIKAYALAYLKEVVDRSKQEARAAKAAESAAAHAPAVARSGRPAAPHAGRPRDDFRAVNDAALRHLSAWVPQVLPKARTSTLGYRISSKELGRDLQEDLSLTPEGIMDFGAEEALSPIDVCMRWGPGLATAREALRWLAPLVGVTLAALPARRLALAASGGESVGGDTVGMDDVPTPPPDESEGAPLPRSGAGGRRGKNANTPPEGVGGGLKRLEESFRLIYGTDAVWDGEQRIEMAVKNLRLIFGNDTVKAWLASPERRMVLQEEMIFEPGLEVGEHQVNLFDGLPMLPVPCEDAEVEVMLQLLRHLCSMTATATHSAADVMDWVLKWLAYPLQNVGAKMRTALVFHGPQGTGKNLFFDCIRVMYGKYGRMVGQTELDDKFNDWLSAKLLIIGNEVVTRQELFHQKNKLKWIVTEDEIPIRGMHKTVRWESNHAQVVFLSNETQPLAVEKDDRRYLVVYTPTAGDEDLYLRVADFLKQGGAAKFMAYLQRYDIEGFGEHAKPIMTEAKAALIELGLKPAERFINEWVNGFLPLPVNVCSGEQLYRVFTRWSDMTGERWPGSQAQFTQTAQRHVLERVQKHPQTGERLPPRLAYKVVMLKGDTGPRKAMRCWIPRGCAPDEGVSEGEWASAAVDAFEDVAASFGRRNHHGGDDQP